MPGPLRPQGTTDSASPSLPSGRTHSLGSSAGPSFWGRPGGSCVRVGPGHWAHCPARSLLGNTGRAPPPSTGAFHPLPAAAASGQDEKGARGQNTWLKDHGPPASSGSEHTPSPPQEPTQCAAPLPGSHAPTGRGTPAGQGTGSLSMPGRGRRAAAEGATWAAPAPARRGTEGTRGPQRAPVAGEMGLCSPGMRGPQSPIPGNPPAWPRQPGPSPRSPHSWPAPCAPRRGWCDCESTAAEPSPPRGTPATAAAAPRGQARAWPRVPAAAGLAGLPSPAPRS